jgi:hypothetical protein
MNRAAVVFNFLLLLLSKGLGQDLEFLEVPENYQLYARNAIDSTLVSISEKVKKDVDFEALSFKVYKDCKLYDNQKIDLGGKKICSLKNRCGTRKDIEGQYIVTFQRDDDITSVTLQLNKNKFSGESDKTKFPFICNGIYSISNSIVKFKNQCVWQGDFNWSLILVDTWEVSTINDTLTMSNSIGDIYRLTKR